MRRIILLCLILLSGVSCYAQEVPSEPDTTQIDLGYRSFLSIKYPRNSRRDSLRRVRSEAHWMGIDVGATVMQDAGFDNSFSNAPYLKNNPSKSLIVNLNLIEYKFQFGTPIVGLTTGLGFSFRHISIRDNYQLFNPSVNTNNTLTASVDTVFNYKRNRLTATYTTIPLLIEFNSHINEWKSFYASIGVIGSVRIGSSYIRKGTHNDVDFKFKERNKFGLNPFQLDASLRVGYKNIGVFVQYGLIQFFEPYKTERVHPLTFGVSLNI